MIAAVAFLWLAQGGLARQLETIARETPGKVGIACAVPGQRLACNWEARSRPPMQSVFKFPLALAALARVEKGEFTLDQPVRFLPGDRILPRTYSPLQDKYPEANVDVPLHELLRLAVSLSDNAAADVVLRVLGGPARVTAYLHGLGIRGFMLKDGEATLHRDPAAQYRNWFRPDAAVRLLRRLADRSPLNAAHTALLLQWMTESPTGAQRIKAGLPPSTPFAHKTGTSGTRDGRTAAVNDIGLITLPDGRRLALAIFVSDFQGDTAAAEHVHARVAQAVWSHATRSGR